MGGAGGLDQSIDGCDGAVGGLDQSSREPVDGTSGLGMLILGAAGGAIGAGF